MTASVSMSVPATVVKGPFTVLMKSVMVANFFKKLPAVDIYTGSFVWGVVGGVVYAFR